MLPFRFLPASCCGCSSRGKTVGDFTWWHARVRKLGWRSGVCEQPEHCRTAESFVLPLNRKHLARHPWPRYGDEDFFLFAVAHIRVELNQVFLAGHGDLKVFQRHADVGKSAMNFWHQV